MTSQTSSSPSPSPAPGPEEPGKSGLRAGNCAECGTRPDPGESFCDGCGAVLNWTPTAGRSTGAAAGASADAAPEPARAEPEEPRDPAPEDHARQDRTPQDRTPQNRTPQNHAPEGGTPEGRTPADGTPEDRTPSTPARREHIPDIVEPDTEEPDTTPTIPTRSQQPPSATSAPAASSSSASSGSSASSAADAERARALLVPVADPNGRPAAPDVAPVLPGRPAAARPRVQAPGAEPADETGPPCPWCSTGNRPDRHFCRRCAMALTDRTQVADAPRPWWRRMWWGAGERPAPWAGDRPRLRRGIGRIFSWIAGALALGLLVFAAFNVDNAWNAARDHFAKRAQVSPDTVAASRSFKDHDAKLVFDKISNSWWGPGISEGAEGEWIEARFQEPTRLLDLMITSGISKRSTDLTEAALPHRIDALVTRADGTKFTRQIVLDQVSGPQRRKFRVGEVSSVRFIIRSAYGTGPDKQVSIAEIEFFRRSSSNDG
ncbi:NADase-type glycan-binding domain-containing protein [Streptomyces sp. NPDC087851]|uniref:NADase-type glycan-binding domain-containing protein n=1 Tax=Streptomyces sp. NPDC087851 TaxID=3365810 RepID=UPI0037F63A11